MTCFSVQIYPSHKLWPGFCRTINIYHSDLAFKIKFKKSCKIGDLDHCVLNQFETLNIFVFLANLSLELSMPSIATNKWSLGKVKASCFLLLMAILDRLTRSRCLNLRADEKSNSAFDLLELLKWSIPAQISHLLWLLYLLKRTGSVNKYQHEKHGKKCDMLLSLGHTGEGGVLILTNWTRTLYEYWAETCHFC